MRNWQLTKASNCRRLTNKEHGLERKIMEGQIKLCAAKLYFITVVCHVIRVFSPYYSVFFPFLKVVNKKTNKSRPDGDFLNAS